MTPDLAMEKYSNFMAQHASLNNVPFVDKHLRRLAEAFAEGSNSRRVGALPADTVHGHLLALVVSEDPTEKVVDSEL